MPGIFGVAPLRKTPRGRAPDTKRILAEMLALSMREDFHEDLTGIDCGTAAFAVRGVPGLGRRFSPFAGSRGIAYGEVRHEAAPEAGFQPAGLKGFFSVACVDADGTLWVVADKCGSQPVYYATFGDAVCFAPEVRALGNLPGIPKEKDPAALASLMVSGHLYSDQTLYRAIRRLKGGHALRVADGRIQVVEYWRFSPGSLASDAPPVHLASELADKITFSVARDLADSKPEETAIFLSGGYDSRAILGAAAAGKTPSELRTVTWGLDEKEAGSDAAVALELAKATGTHHRFFRRGVLDYGPCFEESCRYMEWQSDVAAFHPEESVIMRQLRGAGFRRVLRGDETFGWKRLVHSLRAAPQLVGLRPFHLAEGLGRILQPDAHREMAEASRPVWEEILQSVRNTEPNQAKDRLYFTQRFQNYLNSAAAHKRAFLDHRNPLLADEILDFLSLVPDALREDKQLLKMAVGRNFPAVANLPLARTNGLENWETLLHSKSSFRAYVETQLADRSSSVWEIFRPEALERLLAGGRGAGIAYSASGTVAKIGRQMTRASFGAVFPSVKDRIRAAAAFAAPPDRMKIFMRFLVIKNWCDSQR